jgi:predicted DsbA family dithiol-disulfide isomerase
VSAAERAVVEVTYYTDPLCSWSWAMEPEWRRVRNEFGDRMAWRYRMGGMIADWSSYRDPLNDVAVPAQMGPRWMEVGRMLGVPIDPYIWEEDPPASSYPACVAVKAAERQGREQGERYLLRLREAVMRERRNIARRDVLIAVANELARTSRDDPIDFDADALVRDIDSGAALELFRDDLLDVSYRQIGRFPTMIVRAPGKDEGVVIVGYRPYTLLRAALTYVAPALNE